jgi:pimeloyl-ACP methyl ester carboxylesterase
MSTEARPPIRQARGNQWGGGILRYDTWSATGRPVLLLPSVLFDRTMWWPAAAQLQHHAAPIAVDLPGHGESPARPHYDPEALIDELAGLLYTQRLTQAPVVVGHGASAGLAGLFARRYATRALVLVNPYAACPIPAQSRTPRTDGDVDDLLALLAALSPGGIPSYLRYFARPHGSAALLAAYRPCLLIDPWTASVAHTALRGASHSARMLICGRLPTAMHLRTWRDTNTTWQCHVYGKDTAFPHLADVERFCAEIGALL